MDIIFLNLTGRNVLDEVAFRNLVNLDTGAHINEMKREDVFVNEDGTFTSTTGGDLTGGFYGTIHSEVGGTLNRDDIIGAFGGVRQ